MSLFETFASLANNFPDRKFLITDNRSWTYQESLEETIALSDGLAKSGVRRVLLQLGDNADTIFLLVAGARLRISIAVVGEHCGIDELKHVSETVRPDAIIASQVRAENHLRQFELNDLRGLTSSRSTAVLGNQSATDCGTEDVLIFTTGTTGRPKAARYEWRKLLSQSRVRNNNAIRCWALLYQMNHFASYQMLGHVLANAGTLVAIPNNDIEKVANEFRTHEIEGASATPTFWRMFCGQTSDFFPSVLQVTLGGEAATQDIIDRLRERFPNATVTHVYATTELGSCFSVSDGLAGFPVKLLNSDERVIGLKIHDGELYVRTPHGMAGYEGITRESFIDDWRPTGDMVEQVGDRVYFRGRRSEIINVGGVKVQPAEVEEVIQQVPGVQLARVYGQPNPVVGFLVVADIVPAPGEISSVLETRIRDRCRATLDRYKQPRLIKFCEQIPTSNSKIVRRGEAG